VSWDAIGRMGITLRPFDDPPLSAGTFSPFDSPLSSTLQVLERELRHLEAERIVLQVGYREQDLRLDGLPRANSRMLHSAVALSFGSKWGPLRYETNEFVGRYYKRGGEGWEVNLRAIALAMEALRRVDRYGVSKRGEQYTGWRALPMGDDGAFGLYTADAAEEWLADTHGTLVEAIKATHPDHGGDAEQFRKVMRAKELIGA
jgi:hypothetical protein